MEVETKNSKLKWYVGGLHFECIGCGNCCAGPDEGYIWINRQEIEKLADYLDMTVGDVRQEYLVRIGTRTSIAEKPVSKDCVFLTKTENGRRCAIYPVKPRQCRTWPFWPWNLKRSADWNIAAQKCPGINRGRLYTFQEIEGIK